MPPGRPNPPPEPPKPSPSAASRSAASRYLPPSRRLPRPTTGPPRRSAHPHARVGMDRPRCVDAGPARTVRFGSSPMSSQLLSGVAVWVGRGFAGTSAGRRQKAFERIEGIRHLLTTFLIVACPTHLKRAGTTASSYHKLRLSVRTKTYHCVGHVLRSRKPHLYLTFG